MLFSTEAVPFYVSTNNEQGFQFLYILANAYFVCLIVATPLDVSSLLFSLFSDITLDTLQGLTFTIYVLTNMNNFPLYECVKVIKSIFVVIPAWPQSHYEL